MNADKGRLGAFIEAVKTNQIPSDSILICESLDRISRNQIVDALALFTSILKLGITIITLNPQRVHTIQSINEPGPLLESILLISRGHEESAIKSNRVCSAWTKKKEVARTERKPLGRNHPWWLRLNNETGAYEPIPERVYVIHKIFELAENGMGTVRIIKCLDQDPKVVPPKQSKSWTPSAIGNLFKNRKLLGEYQPCIMVNRRQKPQGDPIKNFYPAVVSEASFYRVIEQLKRRTMRGREPREEFVNIFKSKLYCIDDFSPVYQFSSVFVDRKTKQPYLYRNLMSSAYVYRKKQGSKFRLKYYVAEKAFLTFCNELDPSEFMRDDKERELRDQIDTLSLAVHDATVRIEVLQSELNQEKDKIAVKTLANLIVKQEMHRELTQEKIKALRSQSMNHKVNTHSEIKTLFDLLTRTEDEKEKLNLRLQIRSRIDSLVDRILISVKVSPKRKGFQPQYFTLFLILFRDGSIRWLVFDQDANLVRTYLSDDKEPSAAEVQELVAKIGFVNPAEYSGASE